MWSLYFLGTEDESADWMKDRNGRVFVFTHKRVAEIAKKHLDTAEERVLVLTTPDGVETVHPKLEKCFDAQGKIVENCM